MKLYASPRSPFVRKVLVAIHELGLQHHIALVPIVVKMEEPNAEMLALNPLGKIPTLVLDDGSTLFDSLVIIDYLDRLTGSQLIPAQGEARDWVLKHHALANGLMDILVLWRNERDKPEAQQSQGWITNFGAKTGRVLDAFEALAPALAARPMSLAHITIAAVLAYLDFRFAPLAWRTGRSALAAWFTTMEARPSMQARLA